MSQPLPQPKFVDSHQGATRVPTRIAADLRETDIPCGLIGYEYRPLSQPVYVREIGERGLVAIATSGLFRRIALKSTLHGSGVSPSFEAARCPGRAFTSAQWPSVGLRSGDPAPLLHRPFTHRQARRRPLGPAPPASKWTTACNRIQPRAALSVSVSPPPCAYSLLSGYRISSRCHAPHATYVDGVQ